MNGARSFLAGALALASMGLGANAPRWVVAQGLDAETYPLTTHLTGFGISQAEGDEGSKRRQAMAMAREALAASIRTRVQSEFVKQVQVKDPKPGVDPGKRKVVVQAKESGSTNTIPKISPMLSSPPIAAAIPAKSVVPVKP